MKEKKGSVWSRRWIVCLVFTVVQWSHQEASSVCEALLSQRIPSTSSQDSPSSLSSILLFEFLGTWILSITIIHLYLPASLLLSRLKASSYAKVATPC